MSRIRPLSRLCGCLCAWLAAWPGGASGADSTVVFNELHYHPAVSEADSEWIELHNPMAVSVDMSHWQLTGGVQFRFPDGTILPGGGYLLVAGNPSRLATTTGATNVVGPLVGRLSNSGETLELRNNSQRRMDEVDYETEGSWPVGPDGMGVTLAKRDPDLASGPASNWTMSAQVDGTPGTANFPTAGAVPPVVLVGSGQAWRIESSGTDLGAAWREPVFDAAAWRTGPTPLFGGDAPVPAGERKAIPTLFNSGVGPDGRVLAPGSRDPHYTVTASAAVISPPPPSPALVITGHPAWLANDDASSWLGPVDPGTTSVAAGPYRVRTSFDLAGFDPATAVLTVNVSADNRLNNIALNGRNLGLSFAGFDRFSPDFRLASGFVAGPNTLEFFWANDDSSPNPAGIRVKAGGTALTVSAPDSRLPRVERTSYFRKSFVFAGNPSTYELALRAVVDDGAVVYLNGAEILRVNMPEGPVGFSTPALSNVTSVPVPVDRVVPAGFLRPGTNVVAVEVHQATTGMNDVSFDLVLAAQAVTVGAAPSLVFNEVSATPADGYFVELGNRSSSPVSLTGYRVIRKGSADSDFVFPAGTTLNAGGLLALDPTALGFRPADGDRLALMPPGANSVADAVVVKRSLRGRFPDLTGAWLFPARATPGASNLVELARDVVLNEIFYHPHVSTPGEPWIELHNRGTESADLSGWRFDSGIAYRFPSGTLIPAGGYLVVAKDPETLRTRHPGIAVVGPFTNSLSRRGERLALVDARGNPADEVRYLDGGRWSELADGGGSSLELRNPLADNAAPESWAASREHPRSRWNDYIYTATAVASPGPSQWREFVVGLLDAGECLLDDLKVVESPSGAPVSLLQNGDFERGAVAWRFLGTHRLSRVITDPDNPANHVLHLVATGPTEHMHNHLETTLANSRSVVNGRAYQVSFRAKWLGGDNQLNTRLYFNRAARTTRLWVPSENGTPGARNSTFDPNPGPTFANLSHSPVVPAAGQPVRISVDAADPDGLGEARVFWSANGGAWQSVVMTSPTPGSFVASLPGNAAGTVVQFYVRAADAPGVIAMFPAAGPESRALYQVNDQRGLSDRMHNLRLVMTPADRALLHAATNVMSNESLGATVLYDDREVFYDAGVHLQGSERGRLDSSRVGFTLRFPPDHLFRGVHDGVSIDRSGGYTGVGADQDEILLKHVIQHAGGLPGMYDDLIRVLPPRADLTGSGLLVLAKYGDVFLDSQFERGSEGNQFKLELIYSPTSTVDGNVQSPKLPQPDDVVGVDITDLGNDPEVYRWFFLQENNRSTSDYRQVMALGKALSRTGATLDAESQRLMDVSLWMRAVAFQTLFGLVDAYPFDNPHNFIVYFRPEDGRALPFLWDMDFNFGAAPTSPINRATGNLGRLMNLPANQRLFQGHLLDILTTTYNTGYLTPWINHYGGLLGQNFGGIRTYVDQRARSVRSQLGTPVGFSVTAPVATETLVDAATFNIAGQAWIDVRELRIRDRPGSVDWKWLSTTRWQASVPLLLGVNRLEIQAFDFQGNVVTSRVVQVTSTASSGGVDTDRDGMPDLWETAYGFDPATPDASLDADEDGLANGQEYLTGTDPRDGRSRMTLGASSGVGGVRLSFVARAGRSYSLLWRDAASGAGWQRLADASPEVADREVGITDPAAAQTGSRLYRLVTPRLP